MSRMDSILPCITTQIHHQATVDKEKKTGLGLEEECKRDKPSAKRAPGCHNDWVITLGGYLSYIE
jgi:hypothetical protein